MLIAATHPQRRIAPKMLSVRQRPAGAPSPDAATASRPPVAPRHVRGDAALVQENQLVRVDPAHRLAPSLAPLADRLDILLGGVERLFLHATPAPATGSTADRCSSGARARPAAATATRARSGRVAPQSTRPPGGGSSGVNLLRRPRGPDGGRAQLPVRRNVADTFLAQPRLTWKRLANTGRLPSFC